MNNTTQTQVSFRKLYAFGEKLPIDLSLSENPLGCSPKVIMALKDVSPKDFFDYPDPDSQDLKNTLSKMFQINSEDIFVANGSEAIIKLLPQAILKPNDEVIIPKLTFPMFEKAVQLVGGKVVFSEMTADFDINLADIRKRITKNTKLIFLCNPNNPTGKIIPKDKILEFARSINILVVVDEANIEFGGDTVIRESQDINNLIVLRTFSKGFGLAGLRIGFCVAKPSVVERLKQIGQPFPVSSIAQKLAITALKDKKFMSKTKRFMKQEKEFLTRELENRGFKVIKSEANNLLVKINPIFESSTDFVRRLNSRGVSVVDGINFDGVGIKFVRISPRLRDTNIQLLKAIDEILVLLKERA
ncbi:histidinol-phosphate transaminase [Candidatus Daviesbacteria bacterium RIFCSPLOWO2_02_FULL_36_7]|uniref:Histidinol-phosphate transaminase n=1 Tax=Candidatus Daviesbacteria bacterium RIFCSPLOWO2_02_FULL_36_7 TaxID=1797792 RepID=A0A1F5MHA1_9BACT|nr:MAG: histidinol-phosphate transaminase [Candidatus Daviesbacteria bacterium RIFCSPLOWO2_02_FULL_36_7]